MSLARKSPSPGSLESNAVFAEQELLASGRIAAARLNPALRELISLREYRRDFRGAWDLIASLPKGEGRKLLPADQWAKMHIDSGDLATARLFVGRRPRSGGDELRHQAIRIAIAAGDFATGLNLTNALLADSSRLPGITRLALHQMRANCFLELGFSRNAWLDLDRAAELSRLYPYSSVNLYCDVLRARSAARLFGISDARAREAALWDRFRADPGALTADVLLTLLRLKIDLNRLEAKPTASAARACVLAARECRDDLYEALARVDEYFGTDGEARAGRWLPLQPLLFRHERAARLYREVVASDGALAGETARTIRESERRRESIREIEDPQDLDRIDAILLVDEGLRVRFGPWETEASELSGRPLDFARAIRDGIREKDAIFARVWNLSRDRAHRHDGLLRMTLTRLREIAGVRLRSRDGWISTDGSLLV